MFRVICLAMAMLHVTSLMAEEKIKFDGICRITSVDGVREKQWSGVAISETQVVSVWHPEEAGEVFLEFAEQKHGSKTRIRIAANVRKLNRRADLALIEFNVPRYVKIATYKVKRRDASKVTIRGYVNQTPMVIKDASLVRDTDTSDGFRLDRFDAPAMSGLSGSGAFEDPEFVVGIQTAGNDQLLTVPGDVVLDFISGEVGDER